MRHPLKNVITLILFTLLWGNSLLANPSEITLPPMPSEDENSKTLLGIDTNKNGVRDDVEIYIYNNISQDRDVFNAYLQSAKTDQLVLKYFPKIDKLKALNKKVHKDIQCISLIDKRSEKNAQKFSYISILTFNIPQRSKIEKWIANNSYEISSPVTKKEKNKIKREEVCDF